MILHVLQAIVLALATWLNRPHQGDVACLTEETIC